MYTHSQEEAEKLAQRAMNSIVEFEVPFTPDAFEVFYGYHAGDHKAVNAEIDSIKNKGTPLTGKTIERLAQLCRSSSAGNLKVNHLANEMSDVMESVLGTVRESGTGKANFSKNLAGFAEGMAAGGQEDVLIQQMLQQTKEALEQQWALEDKLNKATEQISDLQGELEDATTASMTDQLTGVANRRAMDEFLEVEIARGINPISVIVGDVDHFKNFNDTWGHAFGDQVLKLVAHSIQKHEPDGSLTARFGGEEFVLVAPRVGLQQAMEVADSARKFIGSKTLRKKGSQENVGNVTISMGVASRKPGESPDELFARADKALYQAKENGRNQVISSN